MVDNMETSVISHLYNQRRTEEYIQQGQKVQEHQHHHLCQEHPKNKHIIF